MKKAFDQYRWITGSTRAGGTVWEGPDHFLFIETQAFIARVSESYRRIDFRNVQAISIAKTQHRLWYNVVGVLLLGLGGWISATAVSDDNSALHFFGFLFGVPGLIVLAANWIKGPTVRAKVLTAVQVMTVRGIKRQKAALKLVSRAAELCMIHQGELPKTAQEPSGATPAVAIPLQGTKTKLPFAGSKSVTSASVALIAAGGLQGLDSISSITAVTVISGVMITIAGMLCIAGLGRNRDRALPSAILGSLWTGVFLTTAVGIGMYILLNVSHFQTIGEVGSSARVFSGFDIQSFDEMAKIGYPEWPRVATAMVVSGVILIFCGLIALPAAIRARRLFHGHPSA
ncbi:MAG: hypothetical protein JNJ83_01010 [Verrucomicrobiaceae bacterium]|nr:hypothetical protein [Verrucomicrobiaceae bacterium]